MKKLIYIFVALTAFFVGVVIFYMRPIVTPVSLCEISQHAELYRFKEIHVKAFLFVEDIKHQNPDSYAISDYQNGCVKHAILNISEDLKNNVKFKVLVEELRQKNNERLKQDAEGRFVQKDKQGTYVAEVEVTGKIEEFSSFPEVPFVLKAEDIKQVSPIRFLNDELIHVLVD